MSSNVSILISFSQTTANNHTGNCVKSSAMKTCWSIPLTSKLNEHMEHEADKTTALTIFHWSLLKKEKSERFPPSAHSNTSTSFSFLYQLTQQKRSKFHLARTNKRTYFLILKGLGKYYWLLYITEHLESTFEHVRVNLRIFYSVQVFIAQKNNIQKFISLK